MEKKCKILWQLFLYFNIIEEKHLELKIFKKQNENEEKKFKKEFTEDLNIDINNELEFNEIFEEERNNSKF